MSKKLDLNKNHKIEDFSSVAMVPGNPKYEQAISRITPIYTKNYDPRSPYERDLHRILHCTAYRRMKNKTQVFFATDNDHICTRIEHVSHVASVSETIAKQLNLNLELVSAIAYGHDLGHAPFGHQGEYILDDIVKQYNIQTCFWHEANSLHFIDDIETLPDYHDFQRNMNLTYAVRDGIVCHCGELDEQVIKPRNDFIDLYDIQKGGKTHPFTYEGCIVKLADKIAYLGRDIEDALINKILTKEQIKEIRAQVGNKKVLLALSGGVDSSVCAALLIKAIGNQLTCVHVNHGLLRKGEPEQVIQVFKNEMNANLIYVDAVDRFLDKLAGVSDPESKRKIIGKEFIDVFAEEARKLDNVSF